MTETQDWLRSLMSRYTIYEANNPAEFKAKINEFLAMQDAWEMEGFTEEEKDVQRDYSVNFKWGHNHDFGEFQIEGLMGDRHIDILATFIDDFGLPKDLTGKNVMDVGVWCGGTSLLLAAMGAKHITALEEVHKYASCFAFLAQSFGLDQYYVPNAPMYPVGASIYEHDPRDFFDHIIFPGVLYHLTDPILALRILFNALKDGGELYLETMIYNSDRASFLMEYKDGKGSNWFAPSPPTLAMMLQRVGFQLIDYKVMDGRLFAKATRTEWKPMLQAGLSRRIR